MIGHLQLKRRKTYDLSYDIVHTIVALKDLCKFSSIEFDLFDLRQAATSRFNWRGDLIENKHYVFV